METTTHSTSKGDVLPATDTTGEPQTFEQRMIRTLVGLERRRLRMAETELEMEGERLAMQRESLAALHAHRVASSKAVLDLVQLAVPLVLSFLERTTESALDEDALHTAIADVAREFPDLKDTLEQRARARREAESRASVG
jgi:hypothetical protein